jgi:hypothetical protein
MISHNPRSVPTLEAEKQPFAKQDRSIRQTIFVKKQINPTNKKQIKQSERPYSTNLHRLQSTMRLITALLCAFSLLPVILADYTVWILIHSQWAANAMVMGH